MVGEEPECDNLLMMRLFFFLALSAAVLSFTGCSSSKPAGSSVAVPAIDTNAIQWMTLDEVQVAMKKEPRKVFMDVYTEWCGWCKVMDKKTFTNRQMIRYVNTKFYAVKLDAERKDSVNFLGKLYGFSPEQRANTIAVELLQGKMSYPTTIVMEEYFQNPQPIPGYREASFFEMILKYMGENVYKTQPFEEFQKSFKPTWL